MIRLTQGNILKSDVEAIVNTVNCVGVMGRGIALQFKKIFPDNFKAYEAACKRGEVKPGSMFVYDSGRLINPRYIINFPTKRHWKGRSHIEDIESGLTALFHEIEDRDIRSVAIPPLGCGLGGLKWKNVFPLIEKVVSKLSANVNVVVYEPSGTPSSLTIAKVNKVPCMTIGRASLIALMRRYLRPVIDPAITLLELQKLMYFMQEAGELLKLNYEKAPYGPYAKTLSHVLNLIEGHFISGYLDGGDTPEKHLELNPKIIPLAETFLEQFPETLVRFERVTNLIQGFETSFGMELLSTVHWVITREEATSIDLTIQKVHEWSPRKKMFSKAHITIASNTLIQQKWV